MKVKPDIPNQGFGFNNPEARNSYELIIRPEFNNSDETALVEVKGEGGFVIESYLISNADKNIYFTSRDKYGNTETSLFGSFNTGEEIVIQRAREYSWWPPKCTGPRCDYGIDIPDLLVFARWRIGKVARTQDVPPNAESTINPVSINITSKSKLFIARFAIRDFIPELTHPLLNLEAMDKFYQQGSGEEMSLTIDNSYFNQLKDIEITVDGHQVNNVQVNSGNEITFIPPQNLSRGEKTILFSALSASEDTLFEINIEENLYYHLSSSPLIIADFDISKSLLKTNQSYLIKLNSSGGGHQNHKFNLISGSFPPGMVLTPSGNIVGRPTEVGVYGFFVEASDKTGEKFIKLFYIEVEQGANGKSLETNNEDYESKRLSVYPNPTKSVLNIDLSTEKDNSLSSTSIRILSLKGEVVYSEISNKDSIQIDLGSLQNGQYIVEIRQGNKYFTEKINIIK